VAGLLDVTRWERRPWDSTFFGISVGQIVGRHAAAPDLAAAVDEACAASIDCLYLLVDADDQDSVRAAETNRFSLVDVRLTLECILEPAAGNGPMARSGGGPASVVRPARLDDLPQLTALARVNHRNTRFHRDTRFDPARSDDLYAVWIERSVAGELADAVWVADVDDAARGYIAVSRDAAGSTIGLVAVDGAYRGRGYGDELLRTALRWSAAARLPKVSVVTQGRAPASVRFYERHGFTASRVELWYHRWLRADR
jgi:dTDP-4-amino-4,6-dideoxy-D-galactose acyltransferase